MTNDVAIPVLPENRPTRSRTMLLLHEELARARMRDRREAAEVRSLQLAAVGRPRRQPRVVSRRLRVVSRRLRLVLRPAS